MPSRPLLSIVPLGLKAMLTVLPLLLGPGLEKFCVIGPPKKLIFQGKDF